MQICCSQLRLAVQKGPVCLKFQASKSSTEGNFPAPSPGHDTLLSCEPFGLWSSLAWRRIAVVHRWCFPATLSKTPARIGKLRRPNFKQLGLRHHKQCMALYRRQRIFLEKKWGGRPHFGPFGPCGLHPFGKSERDSCSLDCLYRALHRSVMWAQDICTGNERITGNGEDYRGCQTRTRSIMEHPLIF